MTASRYDVIIVGGGLAGCLLAHRLRTRRPEVRVLVIERGQTVGGNHTWSFHDSDLEPQQILWLAPLLEARCSGTDVAFPGFERTLSGEYLTVTSGSLASVVSRSLGPSVWTEAEVTQLRADGVQLQDGRSAEALAVVDARGAGRLPWRVGWQKFLGQELRFADPHGLARPLLMDAKVKQVDGFRFFYALPLDAKRLLVEDTRYSDEPTLDRGSLRAAIRQWCAGRRLEAASIEREEEGALPLPLEGRVQDLWRDVTEGVALLGARAGLFHATTGYSLPFAVKAADRVADLPHITGAAVLRTLREYAVRTWREQGYYRLLNRMLFQAASPPERWRVLAHFYRLSEGLVKRFYSGRSSHFDRVRILSGRPPVPVGRAIRVLATSAFARGRS